MRPHYFTALAVLTGAAVGTGFGAGLAAPAMAAGPDTAMTVTVRQAAGQTRAAWLRCDPASGTHPHAASACATLRAAGGNPAAIPNAGGFCTMEYRPVTATAIGRWHGRSVHYRQTFTNSCALSQATGRLFEL